jgi:hypothetical protein
MLSRLIDFMQKLTTERVMLITLFTLIFVMAVRAPIDTDTWWHIRSGEHTLNEGMIYSDPFSHTKTGEEWINHSWGAQVIMYGVWELAGDVGLALLTATLATAGMAAIYPICAGNSYLRAFALVLGATTAAVFWSARPQMISFLFSAVVVYWLYSYKSGRPFKGTPSDNYANKETIQDDTLIRPYKKFDRLWLFVPMMMIWGNLHAGFSIAYILIFAFVVGETVAYWFDPNDKSLIAPAGIRKLVLVTLVSVVALVVNPYTTDILRVPFDTVSIGALRSYIQEWNTPNFQELHIWPFVILLFGTLGAAGMSNKRLSLTDFLLVGGTAFMAMMAARNIALFVVVAVPVLTFHIDALLDERGWVLKPARRINKGQVRLNQLLLTVIVFGALIVIAATLSPTAIDTLQRQNLPVQAVEFIETEQPAGPMFNSYNWGGYLMFALPDFPVYVDGRTDLYKDEFLLRYLRAAVGGDGWRDVLDDDGINLIIVENKSGLANNLREESGWTLVYPNDAYEDEQVVIFVRDN